MDINEILQNTHVLQKEKEPLSIRRKKWYSSSPEAKKKYRENYFKKYPWIKHLHFIQCRCVANRPYSNKNIKNYLTPEKIKYLWFRDKAYLMKNPSIDRIKHGDYIFENCRFIELKENQKRKKLWTSTKS